MTLAPLRLWRTYSNWADAGMADRPEPLSGEYARGACDLCGCERTFAVDDAAGPREGLCCAGCGTNARQRAAAAVLLRSLPAPADAQVYATEQASRFHLALRRHVGDLRGSEFGIGLLRRLRLSLWLLRHGRKVEWIRLEDVTALRLPEASRDAVVSLDVLEHVFDYRAALAQFARVLRPGGTLVLTVPFYERAQATHTIAWPQSDGTIRHRGAPEYHGDPVRGGVLCFHHFGWDLLDAMCAAGFADAAAVSVQSPAHGLPARQWVLRAVRGGAGLG